MKVGLLGGLDGLAVGDVDGDGMFGGWSLVRGVKVVAGGAGV